MLLDLKQYDLNIYYMKNKDDFCAYALPRINNDDLKEINTDSNL